MATRSAAGLTVPAVDWPLLTFALALPIGVAARVLIGWGEPFWFDETFTAVIATQPSLAAAVRWCLGELTGPAYYLPMWAWEKLAGSGDIAFRLPGLALSIAAPLLLAWRGHPDRTLRLAWAAVVLLWLPALPVATEARAYAQLFLLGCLQAIAFLAAMREPGGRRLLGWSAASAALTLTHYYPLVLVAVQGAALAAVHPRAVREHWRSLWPFALVAGWLTFHLPFLLGFARGHAAAYAPMPLGAVSMLPALLVGVPLHGVVVLGTIAASVLLWRARPALPRSPEALLALTGVAAFALAFATGFVRPGFAPRYLTPFMPAVLFAAAWWGTQALRRDGKPVIVVLAMLLLAALGVTKSALTEGGSDPRHRFEFERASAWIAERQPARLVFFWDGPVAAISDTGHLAEVGSFFLHRAGQAPDVVVPRPASTGDPNAVIRGAASGRAAILWLANDRLPADRAPRPAALGGECRAFGGEGVTVLACRPAS